jgi:hypothetical protein
MLKPFSPGEFWWQQKSHSHPGPASHRSKCWLCRTAVCVLAQIPAREVAAERQTCGLAFGFRLSVGAQIKGSEKSLSHLQLETPETPRGAEGTGDNGRKLQVPKSPRCLSPPRTQVWFLQEHRKRFWEARWTLLPSGSSSDWSHYDRWTDVEKHQAGVLWAL